MSPFILAMVLVAQAPSAAHKSILSNDRPEFPIGLAKEMKLLENVNLAAIKDPLGVRGFMEQAAKRGDLLAITSGTKAKQLASHKLRGPIFKELVQVELTDGSEKGLRGWVCTDSFVSEKEYAAIGKAAKEKSGEPPAFEPLYRDPTPGETVYLAPQPTMFAMASSLIRLSVADDSASAVFQEWQDATDSTRNAVLKRLENKKAIFFTTLNTEAKVQKVFPDKMINGVYPVQVELQSGQFKGRVGWIPASMASPVPGKTTKVAQTRSEGGKTDAQKVVERRNQRRQQRSKLQAKGETELQAQVDKENELELRRTQIQGQMQLQMLQQQGAIAEARAANERALANQRMTEMLMQQQVRDAYRNGGNVVIEVPPPTTSGESPASPEE